MHEALQVVALNENQARRVETFNGRKFVWRYFPKDAANAGKPGWHLLPDGSEGLAVAAIRFDAESESSLPWRYAVEIAGDGWTTNASGRGTLERCAWVVEQAVRAFKVTVGPLYPEHEKLAGVKDESQAIGEFLDWLADGRKPRIVLAIDSTEPEPDESSGLWPANIPIPDLLAEYFGIDQEALSLEKDAMLLAFREANGLAETPPAEPWTVVRDFDEATRVIFDDDDARLDCDYQTLVRVLGEPSSINQGNRAFWDDPHKVDVVWCVKDAGGAAVSIYNYKNGPAYSKGFASLDEIVGFSAESTSDGGPLLGRIREAVEKAKAQL